MIAASPLSFSTNSTLRSIRPPSTRIFAPFPMPTKTLIVMITRPLLLSLFVRRFFQCVNYIIHSFYENFIMNNACYASLFQEMVLSCCRGCPYLRGYNFESNEELGGKGRFRTGRTLRLFYSWPERNPSRSSYH